MFDRMSQQAREIAAHQDPQTFIYGLMADAKDLFKRGERERAVALEQEADRIFRWATGFVPKQLVN